MRQLLIAATAAILIPTASLATTIEIKVNGLVCGFCAQGIEKTLRKNAATADVFVSLENKLVAVATREGTDISDAELRQALTNAGYDVKAIERTDHSLTALRQQIRQDAR
jgi:copper chaperone CopZ